MHGTRCRMMGLDKLLSPLYQQLLTVLMIWPSMMQGYLARLYRDPCRLDTAKPFTLPCLLSAHREGVQPAACCMSPVYSLDLVSDFVFAA